MSSISRWFCHFDDDNYVNVPQLVQLLNEYHPTKSWYLGKPSVASPLEIHLDVVSEIEPCSITYHSKYLTNWHFFYLPQDLPKSSESKIKFWFATGGAGFCISRPLVQKMSPLIRGNRLTAISDRIRFPDDVTVGFIIGKKNKHFFFPSTKLCVTLISLPFQIEYLLKVPLTVVDQFHSHFEPMNQLPKYSFRNQVRNNRYTNTDQFTN